MVLKNLIPTYEIESIIKLNKKILAGKKTIIIDVDNTLVYPETCKSSKKIIEKIKKLSKNYKIILVSNSKSISKRKKRLEKLFGCKVFLSNKRKPSHTEFNEIKKHYKLSKKTSIIIGDRLFTDVLFGNRNGVETVLVKKFSNHEYFYIKIARSIEKLILYFLRLFFKK